MNDSVEHDDSRRDFFRSIGRYGLLGVLGLIAAVSGRRATGNQRCVNQGICSGCAVFTACGLPQALSAKMARSGGSK